MEQQIIADMKSLKLNWLGLQDFETALKIQMSAAELARQGTSAMVLGCEHPTVITLGKRGQALTDILASMDILRERKVEIVSTDRGGQATLHNPGQLVLYPILPLVRWQLGVREYVECLERATAVYLASYGMEVVRGCEPGLYVNRKKIAAFGIRIDRGVSLHGVAINIQNSLEDFSLIRQCGQTLAATNLTKEMKEFMADVPEFDLAQEAAKWLDLLIEEFESLKLGISDTHMAPSDIKPEGSPETGGQLPSEISSFPLKTHT